MEENKPKTVFLTDEKNLQLYSVSIIDELPDMIEYNGDFFHRVKGSISFKRGERMETDFGKLITTIFDEDILIRNFGG